MALMKKRFQALSSLASNSFASSVPPLRPAAYQIYETLYITQ